MRYEITGAFRDCLEAWSSFISELETACISVHLQDHFQYLTMDGRTAPLFSLPISNIFSLLW
jgi:hypothetical protein